MKVHPAFQVHMLNDEGKKKAGALAAAFSDLAATIDAQCPAPSREKSLAMTKLEEASFFAKKAMAVLPENQE